ncbi:hypothetical protein PTKIN_Ptkin16aG0028800 [Pterospermum kingtungense]
MCTLPGCGNLYEFQAPETLAHQENPNPDWPVPKILLSYNLHINSKVAYLFESLKALQAVNKDICCSRDEDIDAKHIAMILGP